MNAPTAARSAASTRALDGLRRRFAQFGRGMTIRLLRSRLGRGMGRSVAVITYRGRTSGRLLATPVEYVRDGSRVTILVAAPEKKQWWRNVQASGDVRLLLEGVEHAGSATVLLSPGSSGPLAAYVAERPRAARAATGAVAVVVEMADVAR